MISLLVISLLRNRDGLLPSFLKRGSLRLVEGRLLNTKSDVAAGFSLRLIEILQSVTNL